MGVMSRATRGLTTTGILAIIGHMKWRASKPSFVYVGGPISKGDLDHNKRQALEAANELLLAGLVPIVPHLSIFWSEYCPPRPEPDGVDKHGDYAIWLPYDLALLGICQVVLRLPGESRGADHEVEVALKKGIKVCYSVQEVLDHFKVKAGRQ